ncbi:E3 ubiquitin-protein ligase RNF183 isoform X2 [Pongo abelii]|uniref:E3 ubiquitin-protein ligase RNF183 isoform X2 n=1 Tax=Pongo abelii TaxID=9601 RepID=UPI003003ADB7
MVGDQPDPEQRTARMSALDPLREKPRVTHRRKTKQPKLPECTGSLKSPEGRRKPGTARAGQALLRPMQIRPTHAAWKSGLGSQKTKHMRARLHGREAEEAAPREQINSSNYSNDPYEKQRKAKYFWLKRRSRAGVRLPPAPHFNSLRLVGWPALRSRKADWLCAKNKAEGSEVCTRSLQLLRHIKRSAGDWTESDSWSF